MRDDKELEVSWENVRNMEEEVYRKTKELKELQWIREELAVSK